MVHFQKQNILDWQSRNVDNIVIEFVTRGCEGTEVAIREAREVPSEYFRESIEGTDIHYAFEKRYMDALNGAVLTAVKGKWILKSNHILTRCGCGKSFSFKSGNLSQDKIRLLRSKLSKKPAHTL